MVGYPWVPTRMGRSPSAWLELDIRQSTVRLGCSNKGIGSSVEFLCCWRRTIVAQEVPVGMQGHASEGDQALSGQASYS